MDNKIRKLIGAERVRLRPAVVFGDVGLAGEKYALEMMLCVMSAELRHGYATKLVITEYADGSVGMEDNGWGLYMGSGTQSDEKIWKSKFCDVLFPDYSSSGYEFSYFEKSDKIPCKDCESETYDDLYLCAIQYVSKYMDVLVRREGNEYRLYFEKGEIIGNLSVSSGVTTSGTSIRFKLDNEVFTGTTIPSEWIEFLARRTALFCQVQ